MYQVYWTQTCIDSLIKTRGYLVESSSDNAHTFIARLFDLVETLTLFPERGRRLFETHHRHDIREVLFCDYRIIYRINAPQVETLTILYRDKNFIERYKIPWQITAQGDSINEEHRT